MNYLANILSTLLTDQSITFAGRGKLIEYSIQAGLSSPFI